MYSSNIYHNHCFTTVRTDHLTIHDSLHQFHTFIKFNILGGEPPSVQMAVTTSWLLPMISLLMILKLMIADAIPPLVHMHLLYTYCICCLTYTTTLKKQILDSTTMTHLFFFHSKIPPQTVWLRRCDQSKAHHFHVTGFKRGIRISLLIMNKLGIRLCSFSLSRSHVWGMQYASLRHIAHSCLTKIVYR